MSTVTVSRVVEAPVARVWRLVTDLGRRRQWLSAVTGVDLRTAGPFGTGTVWRESRRLVDDTEVTEEFRVDECVPQARFVVSSPGTGADYRMTYTFAAIGTGRHRGATMVTATQDGGPTAPSGRLLALVLGGLAAETAERALRRDLDDLAAAA